MGRFKFDKTYSYSYYYHQPSMKEVWDTLKLKMSQYVYNGTKSISESNNSVLFRPLSFFKGPNYLILILFRYQAIFIE